MLFRSDEKLLTVAIMNIARTCGDEISEEEPILDARLEDGSRVAAMFPPCSVGGATLTIRRFSRRYSLDDLVDVGSVPLDAAVLLRTAVASRQNVLISGGTGTGKTTLLNAVAATIPDTDRIPLIEETSEILLEKPNYVRFEARKNRAALVAARCCLQSPLRTCSVPRCGTARIALSWVKCGVPKHLICCRHSTPATSVG